LRALKPTENKREQIFTVNFAPIEVDWFKQTVKKYIYHLSLTDLSFETIYGRVWVLQKFSAYLTSQRITGFSKINRQVILDFIVQSRPSSSVLTILLVGLRHFFQTGTIKGWFDLDPDLIRNDDFPKQKISNPNPISDVVREQIEKNLHLLPDSIARMWIVAFFTAMRPHELALLRKDCLVQEGEYWKVVWQRPKTKDEHEVPVTRTIARVIQEQQEYIYNLWGDEWEYLFCHYCGVSETDLNHPKLRPVKRIIPTNNHPLKLAIRCLLKALDIRDENGQPAKFTPKLLRPTRLTNLFEMGHDLAVVSAWAGHKHLATTSTYYTHVSCELMEKEAGHIQRALFNAEGQYLAYESLPKTFWQNPTAHQLEVSGNHLNTPIYGYCGLSLDQRCDKFRACYTCAHFVATPEKLPQYIKVRDELREKESKALANGHDVLVEQFGRQADQLSQIIAGLEEVA
jgi:integrase